jgi:hypothetical protein
VKCALFYAFIFSHPCKASSQLRVAERVQLCIQQLSTDEHGASCSVSLDGKHKHVDSWQVPFLFLFSSVSRVNRLADHFLWLGLVIVCSTAAEMPGEFERLSE